MFGLGMSEIILIIVIALVVIGPKRLPDIAKSLGKGYGEFKRSFGDLKQAVNMDDLDKPVSGSGKGANSKASSEERREEILETYRSQWEQKLPPAPQSPESSVIAENDSGDEIPVKKDEGGASGR